MNRRPPNASVFSYYCRLLVEWNRIAGWMKKIVKEVQQCIPPWTACATVRVLNGRLPPTNLDVFIRRESKKKDTIR